MDVGYVAAPVDDTWVEAEGGLVGVVQGVPQAQQVLEPVDGFTLGVCAVQVHVSLGPADQVALFLQAGSHLRLAPPHGQHLQYLLRTVKRPGRPLQLLLDPATAGEGPLGNRYGLAHLVVDGVLGEPLPDHVHQVSVLQWVHAARRHLHDVGALIGSQGPSGGHGADGGHHEVDGNHVHGALGDTGKLLQQAAGVGDDDRLGHPKAPDPAGVRFRVR